MNMIAKIGVSVALAGTSACASVASEEQGREVSGSFHVEFKNGHDDKNWRITQVERGSDWADVAYSRKNVSFGSTSLKLKIRTATEDEPTYSGEYQRKGWYRYGRYEVRLRAAEGSGLITGFMTHTNNWFGDVHNEINVSFLGKDAGYVVASAIKGDTVSRSAPVELPFNAADGFHNYAFEWSRDAVRWYVEDQMIFEVTDAAAIPDEAQRILLTLVAGTEAQESWIGARDYKDGVSAKFSCVAYIAPGDTDARTCYK